MTELKTENAELTADRDCQFSQLQDDLATIEHWINGLKKKAHIRAGTSTSGR